MPKVRCWVRKIDDCPWYGDMVPDTAVRSGTLGLYLGSGGGGPRTNGSSLACSVAGESGRWGGSGTWDLVATSPAIFAEVSEELQNSSFNTP